MLILSIEDFITPESRVEIFFFFFSKTRKFDYYVSSRVNRQNRFTYPPLRKRIRSLRVIFSKISNTQRYSRCQGRVKDSRKYFLFYKKKKCFVTNAFLLRKFLFFTAPALLTFGIKLCSSLDCLLVSCANSINLIEVLPSFHLQVKKNGGRIFYFEQILNFEISEFRLNSP